MATVTRDRADIEQPVLGPGGWARWTWRQVTSMRTALMLLLLLAVAAVPGSIWPQRSVDPVAVNQYLRENPELAPWLDRLSLFDVYSSPWFAAIYLLLMLSLVGCLIPRTRQHWALLWTPPPATPRRLDRLPAHRRTEVAATPEEVVAAARAVLRSGRLRLRAAEPGARDVAAEGGYLKETGNIVFHLSLLGVIVSVAAGHLWGWRGEVIVPERALFTSSVAAYDTLQPGPWVDVDDIPPFGLRIEDFRVEFETETAGVQFGAPRIFEARVSTTAAPGAPVATDRLAVNDPLSLDGTSVYLLGNGYAPIVTVRDSDGGVLFSDAVPFLPQDDNYTSTGAVKVTGADPEIGFYGAFLPTVRFDTGLGPTSDFPDLIDPALALGVYEGNLFPEGVPQSVYALDVSGMEAVTDAAGDQVQLLLRPGETETLPGGRGSITLEGVDRWAGLVVRSDPGRLPVLVFSITALAGLVSMLAVRRRRIYVRVSEEQAEGTRHTGLSVAGLVKGTDPTLQDLVDRLAHQIRDRAESGPSTKDTT